MGSEWNLNRQSFVDLFTFRDTVIHSFREVLAIITSHMRAAMTLTGLCKRTVSLESSLPAHT